MESKRKDKNKSSTILIVEDSPTQAFQLKQILEAEGFKTAVSRNGKEALSYLKEKRPTVIISDIVMPEMDGYTFCQHVKANKDLKGIPVILLTGLSDPKDVIKGLQCGSDNFITKPYDEKFLLSRIQYVLLNEEMRKKGISEVGLNIYFAGERYQINSNRMQIVDLLLSTYEHAVLQNQELKKTQAELKKLNEQLEEKVRERTQEIERLNGVILAVRNVNQLITRERDRDRLLKGACDSLIESRGYYSAWIIILEENGGFVTTAEAGLGKEFLPMLERLERGEVPGCARQALSRSEVVVIQDPPSMCADCPLAPSYAGRGGLVVRLEHAEKVYGLLNLSVSRAFTMVDREKKLLKEVAEDIAFALHSIELEEQHRRGEEALRERTYELGERVKEMTCLYNMAGLMEKQNISLDEVLQGTVNFIPGGFQYQEIACARIILEDMEFRTENFRETTWKLTQDIKIYGKSIGALEVIYLEQRPESVEGPFLKEERGLLEVIAERLGHIMERMKAEKKLMESEYKYRRLIENLPQKIFLKDRQSVYISCNEKYAMDLGIISEEIRGKTDYEFYPKELAEKYITDDQEVMEQGRTAEVEERYMEHGNEVWVHTVKTPVRDDKGNVVGVLGIFWDVSEKRQLEEQFRQSQKLEAVGRLSTGIAHDFNNLLTSIIGNAELTLIELGKESPLCAGIEEIKEAGNRAASLTRQLLAFSRKQVLQPVVVNINDIIRDTNKMLKRVIGEDIELKMSLAPDLDSVRADPTQIEQIIINLAVNARDAMPKGGKLTIETANVALDQEYAHKHIAVTPGPYVMLAVSDTGIGMTKEVQSRLFEPFFTTKEKGKGTGLGLSTVYGIVKQSNGNIWVYSEPGKGATFKIYLPRVEEKGACLPEKAAREKEVFQGSETVLVVEDNEMVRTIAINLLERCGYTVLSAEDGQEALRICRTHEGAIHLMLTDVVMPGMGGRDLAEQAQGLRPELKVLYMSGYTNNSIVDHGILEKGIAFLQKPFTPDGLARKVREVLGTGISNEH